MGHDGSTLSTPLHVQAAGPHSDPTLAFGQQSGQPLMQQPPLGSPPLGGFPGTGGNSNFSGGGQPPPYDIEAAVLGRALMANFLRSSRTYDILPESAKVVVFDVAVPVKLAFYALVEHGA